MQRNRCDTLNDGETAKPQVARISDGLGGAERCSYSKGEERPSNRPGVAATAMMLFDLRNGIAILERTPGVLDALLRDMPEAWTDGDEGPDTWSPRQVVAHMLGAEETDWMARTRVILWQGAERRFAPFDRVGPIESRRGAALGDLLAEFRALRQRNLAELRAFDLTGEQLRLTGVHPEFGSVTLEQLLSTWVAHDLGHLTQITRTMARHYRDAVGPWRAYLSALR